MPDFFVHPSSVIDDGAVIGTGTTIWHFCHVMPGAKIGQRCNLGQNTFIGKDVSIGNNVKIQNNVSVYSGVVIEDDVFLGPSMVFTNVINPRSIVNRKAEYMQTIVRQGVTIGANVTVVCGITLGQYSFIGAGAVVTHDIPAYALAYGNPARIQGWMCQCGTRLLFEKKANSESAVCAACGKHYNKQNQSVKLV